MAETDAKDFLICIMEENRLHARDAEEKRATLALVVLCVASLLLIVLVTQHDLGRKALPLAIAMVVLGIYGLITTMKLYERSQYHILRARKLRARLDEMYPEACVEELQRVAEKEHQYQYQILSNLRLNSIWMCLYTLIAICGSFYVVVLLIE